jgi:hypothetical protein
MNKIEDVMLQFSLEKHSTTTLQRDCEPGDTREGFVKFSSPFPADALDQVRVIVSANGQAGTVYNAKVVEQNGKQGFAFKVRNAMENELHGGPHFAWLAVLEQKGRIAPSVNLRVGVTQPRYFAAAPNGGGGLQGLDDIYAYRPLPDGPIACLLTACDVNVDVGPAAVAGAILPHENTGLDMRFYNTGCDGGHCAFYWLALAAPVPAGTTPYFPGTEGMWVDAGRVEPLHFQPDCQEGDWKAWHVYFQRPFLVPPFVFVTATMGVSVVGLSTEVTTHGFTLRGRNADCASGQAGFYWVALGCEVGCG